MRRPLKLAVLVSHPIQYYAPLYRQIATQPNTDFRVFFETRAGVDFYEDEGFGRRIKWDVPLLDGYEHAFLSRSTRNGKLRLRILPELLTFRPDVLILHGYASFTNLLALLIARVLNIRVLMRGDTRKQDSHRLGMRKWLKSRIFTLCDGAISVGSLNREYYIELGMPPERVFFAPFSVDNRKFSLVEKDRHLARDRLRVNLGLPQESELILFAAKFTSQKRPLDLMAAFNKVQQSHPKSFVVFAGSGEEEISLKNEIARLGLEDRVRFLGFCNQAELPTIYAACDLFVLPAEREAWGLAVNEVMAAGIPVVVSDGVGAATDLVCSTGAGIVFPCGDLDALARAMEVLLASPSLRMMMGKRAKEVIREWDTTVTAAKMIDAAKFVYATKRAEGKNG